MLRPLGQGGMGSVYLAEDPLLKRRVAIKVVRVGGATRQKALLRFHREAEISAQLNHPNLVTVFDVGVEESVGPFLAMEYVEGKSLARHIKDKSLDSEAAVRVLIQAMRALRAAHRQAIIHRDVKPDNILLSEEGRAKLMDFGIARSMAHPGAEPDEPLEPPVADPESFAHTVALRLTSTGSFMGSPAYAPPEVLRGEEGTPASDRYSFAATAFELLTGQLPHPGKVITEIVIHALREPVALPPDLDPALGAVFQRALSANPAERPITLRDFLEELIDALPGPASMRERLFAALSQEDDGSNLSTARFRAPSGAMEVPLPPEAQKRPTQPLRIRLAEDPVETYLASRRTPAPAPETEVTNPSRKWWWLAAVLGFLLVAAWVVSLIFRDLTHP